MKIHLPEEIAHYEPELQFVLDLMIRKLHINRHKGFTETETPFSLLTGLLYEYQEMKDALQDESQFAIALEAVDIANMAVLQAISALRMDKDEFEERRQQYKFEIQTHNKATGQ